MRPLLILAAALLGACGQGSECVDKGDCADKQICERGSCKTVECATSDDCDMGQWCDPGHNFTCQTGCGTEDDCLSGQTCDDSHQCVDIECRTTPLDCGLGEKCNTSSGECQNQIGDQCRPCDPYSYYSSDCGPSGQCFLFDYYGDGFCLDACNPNMGDEACARGFACTDVGTGQYYCLTDCDAFNYEISHNPF